MPVRHTFLFNPVNIRSDGGTDGVILLHVDTVAGTNRSPAETLAAFKAALADWVNTTGAGLREWGQYEELNIGDIAVVSPSAALMDAMSRQKICRYITTAVDFDLAVEHDTNLVPRTVVTCKNGDDE